RAGVEPRSLSDAGLALHPSGGRGRRPSRLAQQVWIIGPVLVLFLPPAALLFTVLVVVPILQAGRYSFFDWSGYGLPTRFVGWRIFDLIWRFPAFRHALFNNLLIIIVSLGIQLPMALGLASLVASRIRGALI